MNITRCSVADINDSPVLPTVSLQGLGSLNDILSQVQNGIWELDNIKRVFFGMLVLVVVMMGVSLFRVMPLHRLLSTRQIKDLRQLTKVLTIVGDHNIMALIAADFSGCGFTPFLRSSCIYRCSTEGRFDHEGSK